MNSGLRTPTVEQASQLRQTSSIDFVPLRARQSDRALHQFALRLDGRAASWRFRCIHDLIMCDSKIIAIHELLNHNKHMNIMCGIYKITSPIGSVYVGSSRNIQRRRKDYSKPCFAERTRCGRLSASLRDYGWHAHTFEIIEECAPELLLTRERYWQETLDACGPHGLNSNLVGAPGQPCQISDQSRERMRVAQEGKNNPNYGKRGPQTSTWGRKRSAEDRAAISAVQRQRGQLIQQIDPETGAVVREARAWEYREEGWSQGNISSCCTGRLKTYRGFQFRYKE